MKNFKSTYLTPLLFITITLFSQQKKEIWGITSFGGRYNNGVIFKTDSNGNNYKIEHSVKRSEASIQRFDKMLKAKNGNLYAAIGGTYPNNVGVIFKIDVSKKKYSEIATFKKSYPSSELIELSNGNMYGTTRNGGINNVGTIFQFNPKTTAITKLAAFDTLIVGSFPKGNIVQASNGKIYGLSQYGGANNQGVLYEFDTLRKTISKKKDLLLASSGGNSVNGMMITKSGKIFYMAKGGSSSKGVIMEYNPSTNILVKRHDFSGGANGSDPVGVLQEYNGKLYGCANKGGSSGKGIVFQYNLSSNTFSKLYDLKFCSNPVGSLEFTSKNKVFGSFTGSGSGLFEFDISTKKMTIREFYQQKKDTLGRLPIGGLVLGNDSNIYGLTSNEGMYLKGTIFKYNPKSRSFKIFEDLSSKYLGITHKKIIQAKNGNFYVICALGGKYNKGVLFEYDPIFKKYRKLVDFNGKEGESPNELLDYGNGKLYGSTIYGGKNSGGLNFRTGVLFEYDLKLDKYKVLFNFDRYTNGINPEGLTVSYNGKLIGSVKSSGGSTYPSRIFEYDITTNTLTLKSNLTTIGVGGPKTGFERATNGKLYGTAFSGGSFGNGCIYEYNDTTGVAKVEFSFNVSNTIIYPTGKLLLVDSGKLYGTSPRKKQVGLNKGTIYSYNPITKKYNTVFEFDSSVAHGNYLNAGLLLGSNKKLYGNARWGGKNNKGTLYEYDLTLKKFTKKLDFSDSLGTLLMVDLIEIDVCYPGIRYDTVTSCDSAIVLGKWHFKSNSKKTDTLNVKSSLGCDSIVITNLNIKKSYFKNYGIRKACETYKWRFNNKTYTNSGLYTDTLLRSNSCDSVGIISLIVLKNTFQFDTISACDSYKWLTNNKLYLKSGNYRDTIKNRAGCDSIAELFLTINTDSYDSLKIDTCDNFTSPSGKYTWTNSGIKKDTLTNYFGCDSLISIDLKIRKSSSYSFNVRKCRTYSSPAGKIQNQSGNYIDTLSSSNRCDSIVKYQLTIDTLSNGISEKNGTLTAAAVNSSYQWLDCLNNFSPVKGEINKTFKIQINGTYAVKSNSQSCIDTSKCIKIVISGAESYTANRVIVAYPNPTSGRISFDFEKQYDNITLTIKNTLGQIVLKNNYPNSSNIESEIVGPAGIYVIKLMSDGVNIGLFKIQKLD